MKRFTILLLLGFIVGLITYRTAAVARTPGDQRAAAQKNLNAGNFKDAFETYSALALDPADDPKEVGRDLQQTVACLNRLGNADQADDLIEKCVAAHGKEWRLLSAAAGLYQSAQPSGTIIAGKFYRGGHRGQDGRTVLSMERDRVRALQLMQAAMALVDTKQPAEIGEFHLLTANMLLGRRGDSAPWRLQYLTDLSQLPDYDEAGSYSRFRRGAARAPVNPDGSPVFHSVPKSWKDAATDGQRWRWCLEQARAASPQSAAQADEMFAGFLRQQFDVTTLTFGGYGRSVEADEEKKDESGAFAVSTLAEDETIANLATGVKRFTLPDEFNFIKIYQRMGDDPKHTYRETALNTLAQIFTDRQQYDRAAEYWKKSIQLFGPGAGNERQKQLDQILNNWGQLEPRGTAPAGTAAELQYRFRNGTKVRFEADEINVKKLLDDIKAYLKASPDKIEPGRIDIDNVGYRMVVNNVADYRGKQAAAWEMDLQPRAKHFDRRVTVQTPLKAPGAYLIKATMEDGNTQYAVLWIADTVILKKGMEAESFYYVADAVTGLPVAQAQLDFFGYHQEEIGDNRYKVRTNGANAVTDAEGQAKFAGDHRDQWLITASAEAGRFAFLGFTNVWYGPKNREIEYSQEKAFTITDRPVYRPGQSVKFKIWVGHAQYDQEGKSAFAGRTFGVVINNPKGEKILEKQFTADDYGGFDGELALDKEATLGVYSVTVRGMGGGTFRVEEYKKPEFEVKVDAPAEPVMLGEKVTATITSKYYFGAPVTQAKVKYTVMRSAHQANWYPAGRWDWFYEPGYWWFAEDYLWYPGWRDWGCMRPRPIWQFVNTQPEMVVENEVPVGPDGVVKVEIDTSVAKAVHGDSDHTYTLTAEVTDASRRTITGRGEVMVARHPFKVYAWVDRGHYDLGDVVTADFSAQTLDNKPVKGKGELKLLRVTYPGMRKPAEEQVQSWELGTDDQGRSTQKLKAEQPGQYRLSYTVTDAKGNSIEGGYVFVVRGQGFTGREFRFNDLEVVTDKREYVPGDTVRLMINTNRAGGAVLLFVRPSNGVYLPPKLVRLDGKSTVQDVAVVKKDMPNFFVEVATIANGKVFEQTREIVVPPEDRVVNVEVLPSAKQYKPGEEAKVRVKLTDGQGRAASGSAAVSVYDKSVEYVSGGSNVPEIKSFFWKWRRTHMPRSESNLTRGQGVFGKPGEDQMQYLGRFGYSVADLLEGGEGLADVTSEDESGMEMNGTSSSRNRFGMQDKLAELSAGGSVRAFAKAKGMAAADDKMDQAAKAGADSEVAGPGSGADVEPTVRKNFADTAFWAPRLVPDSGGIAEFTLKMPENLTTWKARVWAMGEGTRVGEGSAEVLTTKNLLVRLQAPRFFVQKDEVVLSANVHNYLKTTKNVKVLLELDGPCLRAVGADAQTKPDAPAAPALSSSVEVAPGGEKRVDWRVKVIVPGEAVVRMKALTDEESDATEMKFPVYVHGMLKTESFSGALRPDDKAGSVTVRVPAERIVEQSRLEVRYSPSVATAMVDALPYLVDYPYGCTEQTLNRFLPTIITQKVLLGMKLDLKDIAAKRTNLNAQEIGDDEKRAADWKRNNRPNPGDPERNPVFDEARVQEMVSSGLQKLQNMQLADGGWGWFSGTGEQSGAHTTALVVHGLQLAKENDVAVAPGVLERGVEWLKRYQAEQVRLLDNAPGQVVPYKTRADDLDAFVYMVLTDAGVADNAMLEYCYRDRTELSVYSKAMFGLALHKQQQNDKLQMILKNISQFVVRDPENQTAYLKMPESGWWYWYGTDTEAMGYYLKLLARTDPKGAVASEMSKYLINNRKHATYWNSTRDTAIVIEAMADYIKASGEDKPDMTVTVSIDGKQAKQVAINAANLFSFDNKLVLSGADVLQGEHKIELTKSGSGPLYFNAYLTNFTLQDPIEKAGLEIKVQRKFYKLVEADKSEKVAGDRGQVVEQKAQKYQRQPLENLATLKSGDLVEVELEIDSKNDYEYILFEDMKASGFEPVEVQSGYNGNDLNAYMELHDERVCFFARTLARGKHSVAYRLRAETPGRFSALPTKASAMYAPELRGNSDEMKLKVED